MGRGGAQVLTGPPTAHHTCCVRPSHRGSAGPSDRSFSVSPSPGGLVHFTELSQGISSAPPGPGHNTDHSGQSLWPLLCPCGSGNSSLLLIDGHREKRVNVRTGGWWRPDGWTDPWMDKGPLHQLLLTGPTPAGAAHPRGGISSPAALCCPLTQCLDFPG